MVSLPLGADDADEMTDCCLILPARGSTQPIMRQVTIGLYAILISNSQRYNYLESMSILTDALQYKQTNKQWLVSITSLDSEGTN